MLTFFNEDKHAGFFNIVKFCREENIELVVNETFGGYIAVFNNGSDFVSHKYAHSDENHVEFGNTGYELDYTRTHYLKGKIFIKTHKDELNTPKPNNDNIKLKL